MAGIDAFHSLFRLDGKTALITGGSRGIGFDMAVGFLQAGAAQVILTARKEDGLVQAVKDLNSIPNIKGKAEYIVSNISNAEGIEGLVKNLRQRLPSGKLDILVNNAGASWAGTFEIFEDWKTQKTFDVNIIGPFNLTRRLVPLLRAAGTPQDPSRILLISSTGGTNISPPGPNSAIAYGISKAAMHHLGRNLALDLAPQNIVTNTIAPGWFPTRLANPAIDRVGGIEAAGSDNPVGRLGLREDIAGVAVFLCSRAGAYVNGEDIAVDGGRRLGPRAVYDIPQYEGGKPKL